MMLEFTGSEIDELKSSIQDPKLMAYVLELEHMVDRLEDHHSDSKVQIAEEMQRANKWRIRFYFCKEVAEYLSKLVPHELNPWGEEGMLNTELKLQSAALWEKWQDDPKWVFKELKMDAINWGYEEKA